MNCIIYLKLSIILPLFSVTLCYSLINKLNQSVLVVAVPQVLSTEVTVSWERGQEILPGALEAINHINNEHSVLIQGNISLVVADSGLVTSSDYPYSGNVLEVIANLTSQNARILGVAGLLHPNMLAILQSFQLRVASLIHFSEVPLSPNVIYMTAFSSTLIDSFLAFMKVTSQSKIGIITEINNSFHLKFLHKIITNVNVSFSISVALGHHHESFASIVKTVASSNVYIIVLNVSPFLMLPMLCEAYRNELMWPKYAWILHSYRFNDIPHNLNAKCNIHKVLQGIFTFQLVQEKATSGNIRLNSESGALNPYASHLYDAVWALIVAANQSLTGNQSTNVSPTSKHVYIYQVLNGTSSLTGVYNSNSRVLENLTIGAFIKTNLPIVRVLPSPYFLLLPALCFVLNTVLLVLYIYFRKEPSVKSTSVCLSLLIFTGCYLLIAYTIILIADIPPRIDVCMVLIWLNGLGISLPLILTTLLVKMLRVYHIFSVHKRIKPKVHTSECAHFLYTVLVLSPNIAALIIWTIIDPYRTDDTYIEHPGFIVVEERCKSNYSPIWFLFLLVYYLLLSLAVVIVAIKSRKIRLSQFKDTKKVNFLIFTILFIGSSIFAYSNIFSSTEDFYYLPTYILFFGHIVIAFLCPIALFIPKIWPPLAAKISNKDRLFLSIQDPLLIVRSATSVAKYQVSLSH